VTTFAIPLSVATWVSPPAAQSTARVSFLVLALVFVAALFALAVQSRNLVLRPRLFEQLLQLLQRRCAGCATLAARHHEPERAIERRDFSVAQRSRYLFR
jgi:hypothetical protein